LSYEIFQLIQPGAPRPQAYILRGKDDHHGTEVHVTSDTVDAMIWRAKSKANQDQAAASKIFAGEMDQLFLRAHHDKQRRVLP
jgi:hypothetical protein